MELKTIIILPDQMKAITIQNVKRIHEWDNNSDIYTEPFKLVGGYFC